MKKTFLHCFAIVMAAVIIAGGCKKKDDDSNDDNNNNTTPTTTNWHLNVQVNLGGQFTVLATAAITVDGSTFSAVIATSQIGGAAEVHNFTLNGTINSGTYTMTNQSFTITIGSTTETDTITTGTHSTNGSALTGSGNVSVLPSGSSTPITGSYTVTGTV